MLLPRSMVRITIARLPLLCTSCLRAAGPSRTNRKASPSSCLSILSLPSHVRLHYFISRHSEIHLNPYSPNHSRPTTSVKQHQIAHGFLLAPENVEHVLTCHTAEDGAGWREFIRRGGGYPAVEGVWWRGGRYEWEKWEREGQEGEEGEGRLASARS